MSVVGAIREMLAKGLSIEQALTAAEVMESRLASQLEARKANDRERKRRQRVSRDNAEVTGLHVTAGTTPLPDKEKSPIPPKEINPTPSSLRSDFATRKKTPREVLLLECPGLSTESADAVLAHRKALRRPLTGRAAQLLAKGFLATADPNAAADMMIERGWQGFKPEWFDNERRSNGQQQSGKKRSISDVAPDFIKRIDERFAYLDDVRPSHSGAEGGPTVRVLPTQRGK